MPSGWRTPEGGVEYDAQEATYCELQVVGGPGPTDEHEALWIHTANGDRYCFFLPPGMTFGANPEIDTYQP